MSEDWPFPCCPHCGCTDDRTGHDQDCAHGCNDAELIDPTGIWDKEITFQKQDLPTEEQLLNVQKAVNDNVQKAVNDLEDLQATANRFSEVFVHTTQDTSGYVSKVDVYWPAGAIQVPVGKNLLRAMLTQIHGDALVWHEGLT